MSKRKNQAYKRGIPSKSVDLLNNCKDFKQQLRLDMNSYNPSKLNIDNFKPFTKMAIEKAITLDVNTEHRFPNNKATKVYKLIQALLALK